MKYVPRVLRYLRPYWALAMLAVLLIVLSSLAGLLAPWPLKFLIDTVLGKQPTPRWIKTVFGAAADSRYAMLYFAVLAGLAVTLLADLINVLSNYVQTKCEQRMVLDF